MRYVTGFHQIEEALRAGTASGVLFMSGSGPRTKRAVALARRSGLSVREVPAAELDRMAPGNRGLALACADEAAGAGVDLDDFIRGAGPESLVVVLDHLEDPMNLGAVIRSADVFAADLVVVPRHRSAPLSDAAGRASAGASAWVPLARVANLAEALNRLAAGGFWLYAATMEGTALASVRFPGRTALVLGNEGSGVSRLLAQICDEAVAVPMYGHVDSLNVSATAAIMLYEFRRQHPPSPGNEAP